MRIFRKAAVTPRRLGILPGAFHPPTKAHLALAQAALDQSEAEEVLFVLPAVLPHKHYDGLPIEKRLEMLEPATEHELRFSVAISEGGLFLQIARECRAEYGEGVALRFLCGRDAAERIFSWDYGDLPAIGKQLEEYQLLVAPRRGEYRPPFELSKAIARIALAEVFDEVSSREVRAMIALGQPWEHLVPDRIVDQVREQYAGHVPIAP